MGQSLGAQSPAGRVREARLPRSGAGTLFFIFGAGRWRGPHGSWGEERSPSSCYRK